MKFTWDYLSLFINLRRHPKPIHFLFYIPSPNLPFLSSRATYSHSPKSAIRTIWFVSCYTQKLDFSFLFETRCSAIPYPKPSRTCQAGTCHRQRGVMGGSHNISKNEKSLTKEKYDLTQDFDASPPSSKCDRTLSPITF